VDAAQEWVDEQFYAIVTDLIGAPTELVTAGGEIAWQVRSSLWDTAVPRNMLPSPVNRVDRPLRFPGQYHDAETQLHYNAFRYYDPATVRYQQAPDPLGLDSPHRSRPRRGPDQGTSAVQVPAMKRSITG
jgi:RHS repeat-associated protein